MTGKAIAAVALALVTVASNWSGSRSAAILQAEGKAVTSLGTVTPIDVPGATSTLAVDINASGAIVGRYLSAGQTHGFLRNPEGEFSTIDVPGASFTVAAGINDTGDIVGWYALPTAPAQRHGFLLQDGIFTLVDPPGSTSTNLLGINERGDIVGRYCALATCTAPGTGVFHGFVLRDGAFRIIDVPGAAETIPFGINGSGRLAGGFLLDHSAAELFVLDNDEFVTITLPGGQPVSLDKGGLNERGDVVGFYCDAMLPPCSVAPIGIHGFLISGGAFTPIDIPGATATGAAGINARGDVVGAYSNDTRFFHGYLLSRWIY